MINKIVYGALLSILISTNAFALQVKVVSEKTPDDTLNSFCSLYGYNNEVKNSNGDMIPNPVSKEEFAGNVIRSFVTDSAASYDASIQTESDRKANYIAAVAKHKVEDIK